MCRILAAVPHEFTSHTADVAVELRAASREALFAEALVAFTDTVTDPKRVEPAGEYELEVEARDLESLLVEWLGELVYRFEVDGLLFREAAVAIGDGPEGLRLTARARGESYDEERHPLKVLVKGVTYHELAVREEAGGGWFARVVLDI
ncbi:MAG TPA: archease [Thermoanaerobaculia bacterium]|nr:archease [Thermoanaerobaculia bacterium]